MDKKIPNFCATCVDDEEILEYGTGETVEDAFHDFISNGHFQAYCEGVFCTPGAIVDVHIYTCIDPKDSPWGDDANPDWAWCLGEKIETRSAKAV